MGGATNTVYVGNIPPGITSKQIQSLFSKYGKIQFVDLKSRTTRGPPFAFVEYDDPRDAEDSVRGRDGYDYDGYRLRVEFTRGGGPRGPGGRLLNDSNGRHSNYRGPPPRYHNNGGSGNRRGHGSNYRVLISGLPLSGSWQDLKDHMREAGDVCYADVFKDGTGVVEYIRYEDMKYALRKLDDTKFKSHEGETSYIRVRESDEVGSRRGGRSGYSPRRIRSSPKYSPRHSRSRTPRSRSPRSRSPISRSRTRSPYSRSRSKSCSD